MMQLMNHPIFEETNPCDYTIARVSSPFPDWLNPFHSCNVVIRAAMIPGEVEHSKSYVARELLLGAILEGKVGANTTIIEATSGNTGQSLAKLCNALEIKCKIIMSDQVNLGKINAVKVFGKHVEVILHNNVAESTVIRARREAKEFGYLNLDQYANWLNPYAHEAYLAKDIFTGVDDIDLIFAAAGTMGTCMGLQKYANKLGYNAHVVPVVVNEGENVPGARRLSQIENDVTLPWNDYFNKQHLEFGTYETSCYLSFCTWRYLPKNLGPSFGLAFQGALQRLYRLKQSGELIKITSKKPLNVVIVGADDYHPYLDLYSNNNLIKKIESATTNNLGFNLEAR